MIQECIICYKEFDSNQMITSPCNHGPYCNNCYNNITTPINPKCSICRRTLDRSVNPNQLLLTDINISDRYIYYSIISLTGNAQSDIQDQDIDEYQDIQLIQNIDNRYSTPPRRTTINPNQLNQGAIRRGLRSNRINN